MLTVLLIVLLVAVLGGMAGPGREYPGLAWPGGIVGLVLVVLLILALMGRL